MRIASVHITRRLRAFGVAILLASCLFAVSVNAVNVITNGTFNTAITGWTTSSTPSANGTTAWSSTNFGAASGSVRGRTNQAANTSYTMILTQTAGTISTTDSASVSFFWYKSSTTVNATLHTSRVRLRRPAGDTVNLWTHTTIPTTATPLSGTVTNLDITSYINATGTYTLLLTGAMTNGNNSTARTQTNYDDVVLDVRPINYPPTVTAGATQASPITINRIGTGTSTLSANFSDVNQPAVSVFLVSFRLREPDNITIVNAAVSSGNGQNGVTITSLGGGNYQATVNWDPLTTATRGLYDLRFEVSDGVGSGSDDYVNNLNELTVYSQSAPSITAGVTATTPLTVNRIGTDSARLSATWSDADSQPIDSFWVTFSARKPDNITQVLVVDSLRNGFGGLVVVDNGNGTYTARVDWNPADGETIGLYDLRCRVFDGTTVVEDGYLSNLDELTVESQATPTMTAGVTSVSPITLNRIGTDSTRLSATWSDPDGQPVTSFWVTFSVREPNDISLVIVVDSSVNGVNGLVVVDNGNGTYTAYVDWNPNDGQTTGLYDLRCRVFDGTTAVEDGYANNLNVLTVESQLALSITSGVTTALSVTVNRIGTDSTRLSATWSNTTTKPIDSFWVTFSVRKPDNTTQILVVDSLKHGFGGLAVVNNGDGTFTGYADWNPADGETLGLYDLRCRVFDGESAVEDGYASNLDELLIHDATINDAPVIVAGASTVAPPSVARLGIATTTYSVTFTDADQPAVSTLAVTFRARPAFGAISTVADSLSNGQGGLTIVANGGGYYTASIAWDPTDNAILGYYDLYAAVFDGQAWGTDDYANNAGQLLITSSGENNPPVVQADAVFASPAGVERIGANVTTLAATFTDTDVPGISVFRVSFKLRLPDDVTEIVLANNVAHGVGGVSITDGGGGIYTASINWDAPDAQTLDFYDLYFYVTDGSDTSYDGFSNNLDELQVYDATTNQAPTLLAGNTTAIPNSVNRVGTSFTMLKSTFSDADVPGRGAFTVTMKVRDVSGIEYTVVNVAKHDQQGLRIKHASGASYEASVLWNPGDAQTTGLYDLYILVQDNAGATVADNYISNTDELTVFSAAILGDGNLLHRNNDATGCGGPNSACHNLPDHQGQNCRTCHTPHSTANVYLVPDSIQTPNSGKKKVVFKTLGIGDPYNAPDPEAGNPLSGVMADDADNVHTGVCEVCHTTTSHHRNDDTHPVQGHNNAENCIEACHPHSGAFTFTESSGGQSCACHKSKFDSMDSLSISHRHILANMDANYSPGAVGMYNTKNCLTCHVDHNIFRPDLNPAIGQRAKNLRTDWAVDPILGSSTVLSNSDYSSVGSGGVCLSCHAGATCNGCHSAHMLPVPSATKVAPNASPHAFVVKTDFDAATQTHNYNVTSTFSADGSVFNANCVKCHNDNMAKSYQGAGNSFGTHATDYRSMLTAAGITSPTDPLEEKFCFQCHSTTSNPNAGTNRDYYNVKVMSAMSLKIQSLYSYAYAHPTLTFSGRHSPADSALSFADGNRHAECADCHDPHGSQQGIHDGSTNLVSNALKGTWGVEPTSWAAAPVPTNNGNVFAVPAGYTKVNPAQKEYQICLKCHSNYTTLPTGKRNLAQEINPNYPSQHGIVSAGTNAFCNATTMNAPWASSKIAWCSDCHSSNITTDPSGPHGSNLSHLLSASITSDATNGTPLCYVCHKQTVYWTGASTGSRFGEHPGARNQHKRAQGCFACHMWDYATRTGLGVSTTNWTGGIPPTGLFVHGQNKKWVFSEQSGGTTGSGQVSDAFINGYIANINYTTKQCWGENCVSHAPEVY